MELPTQDDFNFYDINADGSLTMEEWEETEAKAMEAEEEEPRPDYDNNDNDDELRSPNIGDIINASMVKR